MARNLLLVSATLFLFSIVSCGIGWHSSLNHPGTLPGDAALWRGVALVLLVCALVASVGGTLGTLFGQVQRRDDEQRLRRRR